MGIAKHVILVFLMSFGCCGGLFAAEFIVDDSQGIKLLQVDFPFDSSPIINSGIGHIEVDLAQLRTASGIDSGFINMLINGQWQVRNLLVPSEQSFPYPLIKSAFDLGVNEGTDVSELSATIVYTDTFSAVPPASNAKQFPVAEITVSQGGVTEIIGDTASRSSTSVPVVNEIGFTDPSNFRSSFQFDHPNIETAGSQCYPMAIANSLQFLENTTQLKLPHSHVPGLRGDQSLVGQLGQAMNRTVTSRRTGAGVNTLPGIQGKLRYLAENDLHERVQTRHWGKLLPNNVEVVVDGKKASSIAQGASVSIDKIVEALEGGENCEATYFYGGGGGHAVDIVGAGYIAGQAFIIEASDLNQASDSLGAGKNGLIFSHLKDTNNDGRFNMNGTDQELSTVFCQKYVPPPLPPESDIAPPEGDFLMPLVALIILSTEDPANHGCCVTPPPGMLSLRINDGTITFGESGLSVFSYFFVSLIDALLHIGDTQVGTVAGFPGITNTIQGQLKDDRIVADISLGTEGGLPQGLPITYSVELVPEGGWPWLGEPRSTALRINGFRGDQTISTGESVSLGVGVQADPTGGDGEWYIVAVAGAAVFSFNSETKNWVPGLAASRSGKVSDIDHETVFRFEGGLPAGTYTFHFGIDDKINGEADLESLDLDSVVLTVQ